MKKSVFSMAILLIMTTYSIAAAAVGDAEAGADKVAVCSACHGVDGNSMIADNPKLAGQNARYTLKQLQDIKSGAREVPSMEGLLNDSSDQDLADMAAYYATLEISLGAADPELVALGEQIYRAGITDLGVAACSACHSPTGMGNAQAGFPALGGQHASYIAQQMRAFRSGDRDNDETGAMGIVSERLTDREIEALASYVSGLH